MEWQPSEELIAWGNEHFGKLSIDGIWSPDDSGVQYRKLSDNKFALMFMLNHPLAQEHHEKFTILMKACGYEIEEPDGIEMVTPPLDPMAHAEMQYNQNREIAQSWVCNCGFPLANNDLSVSKYEYVETVDAQTNDGGTVPIDLWRVMVSCISCGDDISTDPDDFHLLAGDDLFMSWQSNTNRYIALTREQMKDFADSGVFDDGFGSSNITVLGKMRGDERVPPWLWGIPCLITEAVSEEE